MTKDSINKIVTEALYHNSDSVCHDDQIGVIIHDFTDVAWEAAEKIHEQLKEETK
jgi:hypothetical protein